MRIFKHFVLLVIMAAVGAGAAYAIFTSQAKVEGASFSTGTTLLKIAKTNTPETVWTSDTVPGDLFDNIVPGWTHDYHIFVKNTGTTPLNLTLSGKLTGADACDLSDEIKLSLGTFNDTLTVLGTLSPGIDLGELAPNTVKDVVLSFAMKVDNDINGGEVCTITSYGFTFDGFAVIPTIAPTTTPTPSKTLN